MGLNLLRGFESLPLRHFLVLSLAAEFPRGLVATPADPALRLLIFGPRSIGRSRTRSGVETSSRKREV